MSSNHSSGIRRGPMGHGRGRGPAEKAKDFKGTMAKLIRYLGSYRINIIIAFLFSIVSVATWSSDRRSWAMRRRS